MRDTTPAPAHVVDNMQSRLGKSHLIRLLTAFLLALVTWGWVTQATDPIDTDSYAEIEIVVPELSDNLVIVTALPRARVEVEGPTSSLNRITRGSLTVHLDASSVTAPGDYRLPVEVDAPETDARITAHPEFIQVTVDSVSTKEVPLQVKQSGTGSTTRVVNTITPSVSQVTVSGPSSAVERVEAVVLPVVIDTQLSSFTSMFAPYAVDANDQVITEVSILPAQVMTQVDLQSRGKLVNVIPSIVGQPAEGYSIQGRAVLPVSITVEGPEDVLSSLLFVNTEVVDISGASQAVSQRVGLADLPEGVKVIDPPSGQVEVRVAIQDSSATSQTVADQPVNALNVPTGYQVVIEPSSVDVTVQGSSTALSQLKSNDIRVIVDVRDLQPGVYDLTPSVALPSTGIQSSGTNPGTVQVTIEEAPDSRSSPPSAVRSFQVIANTDSLRIRQYAKSGALRLR